MKRLPERIKDLADATESVIIGWKKMFPREKVWSSSVTVGRWDIAMALVTEAENGSLRVRACGKSVPIAGDVLDEESGAVTRPGEMTLDALEAVNMLRKCAVQSEEVALSMLEWACKELMELGVGPDRVTAAANAAVVKSVMDS